VKRLPENAKSTASGLESSYTFAYQCPNDLFGSVKGKGIELKARWKWFKQDRKSLQKRHAG